ncbi:MAG: glycosyltransferase [Solirubrobacterales bacterium]|nr:glycosyltransferase [Solirubrobacterales bacterium]MBV9716404.1 glycosyltransferase [Solirubrobacterales bacterium]
MTELIPVLLYHSVSKRDDDPFAVTPETFKRHVEAITASGRTPLTVSEIADGLRGLRRLPERSVGITFDDGFADTVDAVDLLEREGLRSTVYITTGFVGSADMISERQLEHLAARRDVVELGAHTITHPYLDELPLWAAEDEVRASKAALEQMIGRPVGSFAYPHGAHDARVRELVITSGYRSAAAVKNAMSHADDDPWAVARWTVRSTTGGDDVDRFLMGGLAPLAWEGERLRTKAYRGLRRARRRLRSAHDASLDGTPRGILPEAPNRDEASTAAAQFSVVVTTCADAAAAVRCVSTIRARAGGRLEVIVVENRPAKSDVHEALDAAFGHDRTVRYVEEPTPGLSRARNAGLAAATGSIVAFIDDDVVVDDRWLEALRSAFAAHPEAACVTGRIEPLELSTRAQSLLEQYAAFGKGLTPRVYRLDAPPEDIPLFPYTAGHFGSGANMAFRREALLQLGGFDPCLGAGTPARGAEDLDISIRLILGGQTLVYEPRAIVRHHHLDTMSALYRKVFSYGIGLGAFIFKTLATGPNRARLIRLIPAAIRYLLSSSSRKNAAKDRDFPRQLDLIEWAGMLVGPIAYARSRWLGMVNRWAELVRRNTRAVAPAATGPVWSGELELSNPSLEIKLPLTESGAAFAEARLLIRVLGEPVGFVQTPVSSGTLDLRRALQAMDATVRERVERQLAANGPPSLADLVAKRHHGVASPANRNADYGGPLVSVIVCTRNRPRGLLRCLHSIQRLRYPNLEFLIIDNAPADDSTKELVLDLASKDHRVRYVREERPGLSVARNRGLREARGEFIAYTDDDVRVDPLWVDAILRGFRRRPDVGCVTGLVATASLERRAEQYFDARVGWSSSCQQRLFESSAGRGDSRLHPYAPGVFGTGANVAFRRRAIDAIGGFDESLGAGSPTCGGEDLDAFVRLLRSGQALTYEPAALVWHEHRVEEKDLQQQMYCYGKGLSAYMCKFLFARATSREVTGRLLVGALHAGRLARRSRAAANRSGVARGLLRMELRGWLAGPWAYFRARGRQDRAHVRAVAP